MNPSYKRRLRGILAAACMLTAATVPAVSPVFSQVSLSVAAAEETDFYKGLKYLKSLTATRPVRPLKFRLPLVVCQCE